MGFSCLYICIRDSHRLSLFVQCRQSYSARAFWSQKWLQYRYYESNQILHFVSLINTNYFLHKLLCMHSRRMCKVSWENSNIWKSCQQLNINQWIFNHSMQTKNKWHLNFISLPVKVDKLLFAQTIFSAPDHFKNEEKFVSKERWSLISASPRSKHEGKVSEKNSLKIWWHLNKASPRFKLDGKVSQNLS